MNPEPKVIITEMKEEKHVQLLGGPPESISMRSGKVLLQPGETIGKHSTESNEEVLVLLEGEGLFILNDNKQLKIKAGSILYCPPETEHDVRNTGLSSLSYIYIVAKAK